MEMQIGEWVDAAGIRAQVLGCREREQKQVTKQQEHKNLAVRLAVLQSGVALGYAEPLEALAAQGEALGFADIAVQARDMAGAALRVAEAKIRVEAAQRKRGLLRWAEGQAQQAQAGDFVFVLDEAGNGSGTAIHLRPISANSGRLRFQVVASLGVRNPPVEYSDVPSRGRAWRWRSPPAGEVEGLDEAQTEVMAGIVKGRLRSGWSIKRANARLAHRAAQEREREVSRRSQAAVSAEAVETLGTSVPDQPVRHGRAEAERSEAETRPEAEEQTQIILHVNEPREPSGPKQEEAVSTVAPPDEPIPAVGSLAATKAALDAPLAAGAVCEEASAYQLQPQVLEPIIIVEGDGVDGQRLAQWQGAARVGLTPVARRLGLDEVQVLVHEDGEASTLVAYWPGGEATLSCPVDGRAGQMRVVRELVQQIRATP
jgi:hypothetical protein